MSEKRRTEELERKMVEMYQSGSSAATIARELGFGETSVYRVLDRKGIRRVPERYYRNSPFYIPKRKFTESQELEISNLYANGDAPSFLEKRFGCSRWLILSIARRHGIKVSSRGGKVREWSDKEVKEIISRYENKESQESIARSFSTHQYTISRLLRFHGMAKGRNSGQAHGSWKGGVVRVGGYIGVHIDPNSLFDSMRMRSGYVLQHRLVMAKKLGRPLMPWETVHHINGDKSDNRIDNLELRVGRHGKGIIMVCADCGSHNIIEEKLKT